jgi:hypothetical protein
MLLGGQKLVSMADLSIQALGKPNALVQVPNVCNGIPGSNSIQFNYTEAIDLIVALLNTKSSGSHETFESTLLLAQRSTDYIIGISEWIPTDSANLYAIIVKVTFCHVIMRLASRSLRQLRAEVAEDTALETLSGWTGTNCPSEPLMLGKFEIRSLQARCRIYEALIDTGKARVEDVEAIVRAQFETMETGNGKEGSLVGLWAYLIDSGFMEKAD